MFDCHYQTIQSYLKAVLQGDINSLMIVGRAGVGKTRLALGTAQSLGLENGRHYLCTNAYFTALELFLLLERVNRLAPPKLLIIDDAEYSLRDRKVISILKGALWETNDGTRRVHYLSGTHRISQTSIPNFTGKIVVLLNEFKANNPLLAALKDRGLYYQFEPSEAEMQSAVAELAESEFKGLPKDKRLEIAQAVIRETAPEQLSLRTLVKAYHLHRANPNLEIAKPAEWDGMTIENKLAVLTQARDATPAWQLWKYAGKTNGGLPEVTGEAGRGIFRQFGDTKLSELYGYEISEDEFLRDFEAAKKINKEIKALTGD